MHPSGKNIRLFENPTLEKLTYVHPLLPIAIWGPVTVYCFASGVLYRGVSLADSVTLFALGGFFWTLAEYLIHRFFFHYKPKGRFQKRVIYLAHGVHHDDPEDARRLLAPPVAAVGLAIPFYLLFAAVLGWDMVRPFFAGFITGYLCYDYIHYSIHYLPARWQFLRFLKKNHMRHHFVTPEKRFGVSNTLWDRVFGTSETRSRAATRT